MARIRKKPSIGGLLIFIIFIGILVTIFNGGKSQPEATKGSSSQTDPKTIYDFSYRKAIEQSGATSWIFEGKNKPPLKLSDKTQFIEDINLALDAIGLPMVSHYVPERESLTGSRIHRGEFLWEDYQLGKLLIHRSICKSLDYKDYDCIWKISVSK